MGLFAGRGTAVAQPNPVATPVESGSPSPAPSLPPAGVIPSTVALTVTGNPADGAFLETQIRAALDRQIRPTLRAGAGIRFGPIVPWPIPTLQSGGRVAVNVSVTIAGNDESAWVSGLATVDVTNVPMPAAAPPPTLFFSDDPEHLQSDGLAFQGRVDIARPARLYYYHDDIGLPRDLDVVLTAATPARVLLVQSKAGPDADVLSVGHTVSRDLLLYEQRNEGTLVNVAPGAPFMLRHDLILQGELVAGAVDMHVLDGGPVTVSVVSSRAGGRPEVYLHGPRLAYDGHNRHGVFDLTGYGDLSASYTVGGSDPSVRYGGTNPTPHNVDASDPGHDYGDYGVVHRIKFTLVNASDTPRPVYLYEKPLGGPVRSTFIVDGQLKEVGCARMRQPYWFMTYQLPPHSTSVSTTLTMTDGGSYYPIEFGVMDTMPVPITPPVGSPEGCSPPPGSPPAATPAPQNSPSPNDTSSDARRRAGRKPT